MHVKGFLFKKKIYHLISLIILASTISACDSGGSGKKDTTPPSITADSKELISDITQTLVFTATDELSGIDKLSLKAQINGSVTTLAHFSKNKITITPDPANYWKAGELVLKLEISDTKGNKASKDFLFLVRPSTAALPFSRPAAGDAPLTVQLIPFSTTDTAIEIYEWDFDNDGTFDISETVGRNQTHVFKTPGKHKVTLRLTDANGKTVTGTVTVNVKNASPQVNAEASPSNGPVPLNVSFSAQATDNEGIVTYAWDFEGDGKYDVTSENATSTTHEYSKEGTFQPVLQVTDKLGAKTDYKFSDIEVRVKPKNYPSVTARAYPIKGIVPLDINFSTGATTVGTRTITKYEWDFDGDGKYDSTTASALHTYSSPGVYFARIRVTDSDKQITEDTIKITVDVSIEQTIEKDTIDTYKKEITKIKTTLGGNTKMALIIEDHFGNPVKTLIKKKERNAGVYEDAWDGKNDQGATVPEGDYRSIVEYDLNGKTKRFDLSLTTGGKSFNPPRTNIPTNFQPFAGKPLTIDFTLDKASEVTTFMGRYNVNTRLVTFTQRQPLGKGVHRIIWNGEDSTGQLIHPPEGDSFLFGIFGYTLPNNAIYVRSGSHITDLTLTPSILMPDSVTQTAPKLIFTLSNKANIRLLIYSADNGNLIASKSFKDTPSGKVSLTWDGKDNKGAVVSAGKYRLGVTAIDKNGFQSMTTYTVLQVFY